jgi:release factor glutamine methyltransferase
VSAARTRLRRAGVPDREAELDARLLAQRVLGWDAARLLASGDEPASQAFLSAYEPLVDRRAGREPMAYILGMQEFWGLPFEVTPAVLVPRPETEIVVEAALELMPADAAGRIADVGTGSGCLAVALARERPAAQVIAIDTSEDALAVAARNAARHHVADRIEFVRSDLLSAPHLADRPIDLIVANPPYVAESDRETLPPEVRDHEPAAALFAGRDGLAIIRRLAAESASTLKPGGVLIFEIGFGQADAVRGLISATAGLKMVSVRSDLQGIPRTIVAERVA